MTNLIRRNFRVLGPVLAVVVGVTGLFYGVWVLWESPDTLPTGAQPALHAPLATVLPAATTAGHATPYTSADTVILQGAARPAEALGAYSFSAAPPYFQQQVMAAKKAHAALPAPMRSVIEQAGAPPQSPLFFALAQHYALLRGLPQRPAAEATQWLDTSLQCVLNIALANSDSTTDVVALISHMEQELARDATWRAYYEKLPEPPLTPLTEVNCHLLD